MKKSKPEHRIEYWRFHVAAHSFEQARDVASVLKSMSDRESLFYPLMTSLHVFYAKPFKHLKRGRNIPESYVPKKMSGVHSKLLLMRDRMFAQQAEETCHQFPRILQNVPGLRVGEQVLLRR